MRNILVPSSNCSITTVVAYGNFFFGLYQHLFPNDFRHHEADRLIGDLVFREIAWAFGQEFQDFSQKHVEAFAFSGGERNDLAEIMQLAVAVDDGQQFVFCTAQQINLVQQQEDRCAGLLRHIQHELVFAREATGHVCDQENQFASDHGFADFRHHLAAERRIRPVNAWSVDQNDLAAQLALLLRHMDDPENAVARGLGLGADDGQLLADQGVQKRGFAGVGTAQYADESGVKGHKGLRSCSRCTET